MKEFIVSLIIYSKSSTLRELERMTGLSGEASSATKGSKYRKGRLPHSVWVLDSTAKPTSNLKKHFSQLFKRIRIDDIMQSGRLPPDAEVVVDIGVLHNFAVCTIEIAPECTRMLKGYAIPIQVAFYPNRM